MVSVKTVLLRFTSEWEKLIGLPAWKAVCSELADSTDIGRIVDYVLDITNSGRDILLEKSRRQALFLKLADSEAKELAILCGSDSDVNPYYSLNKMNFSENRLKSLFNFFELEYWKEDVVEEELGCIFVDPVYPLYNYQKDVITRSLELYQSDSKRNFLIHMPTGSGKTRVAMSLVSRILSEKKKGIVIWLAYSEELCGQASNEFSKSWTVAGDRGISIVHFYGKYPYQDIDDGLIVCSLSKLWSKNKADPTFISYLAEKVTMVVFDEAHQSVAPTYISMLDEIKMYNPDCCFIGLSATPGRSDDSESALLSHFFDNNKVTLNIPGYSSPINYLYAEGYLSHPRFIKLLLNTEIRDDDASLDYSRSTLSILGSDEERNMVIINHVMKMITQDGHKRLIVFAPSIACADFISTRLTMEGIDSCSITADKSNDYRKKAIDHYKSEVDTPIIICNYGVLTAGFDAPKTTAAIIARPTKSLVLYSQMVGRALRGTRMGGTNQADIVTVIDTNLPGFDSVVQAFEQWDGVWNEQ